jgi:lipoic acid synthetase
VPYEHGRTAQRLPAWLRRPIAHAGEYRAVEGLLDELHLATVCQEAKCPNRGECYASGTATFLIAGDACTRGCRFCAVETRVPAPLDADEPARVAEAVARLGLRHAVVTMVTRDDLGDGASGHVAATIAAIRRAAPGVAVEVLVSDFGGDEAAIDAVVDAAPDVFNHNLETVPRLYAEVRPGASYERSLGVLERVKERVPEMPTKSGLMLGLGETHDEVVAVMRDLRAAGCDLLTLGQYLRPSARHLPVAEFVTPEAFAALAREGRRVGFAGVASAPFVRSSYHAAELAAGGERA